MKNSDKGGDVIVDIINELLKALLPALNPLIDSEIRSKGLDPWANVTSGKVQLGKMDFHVCKANVHADYAVTNMTGVSSLSIDGLVVEGLQGNGGMLEGALAMTASFGENLSGDVGVKVDGKCGHIHNVEKVHGRIHIKSLSVSAKGEIAAGVDEGKICVTNITLDSVQASVGSIVVDVRGLGVFDSLLNILTRELIKAIKPQIVSLINSTLTPVLNSQIKGQLPLCNN